MVRKWERLAGLLTQIGLALFLIACGVLIFGTGNVSILAGVELGLFSVIMIFMAIAADWEAICILKEDAEILEEEKLDI